MGEADERFPVWLEATMRSRGLSQAQLARRMGVAETQVSRWRRGLAVPTVHSLQRLADTLDVPRGSLEQLAGYPAGSPGEPVDGDAERDAELRAYQALLGQLLAERVPRELWQAYLTGCASLADSLRRSFEATLRRAEDELRESDRGPRRAEKTDQLGFRTPGRG